MPNRDISDNGARSRPINIRSRLRGVWNEQWGSQGLEAAGAALAAAIIIGALLLMAPSVGGRVERALACAASVLTGGGSCAGGSATTTGGTAQTGSQSGNGAQEEQADDDDCSFLCQARGFFKGVSEGAVDFVKGIGSLAVDGYGLITGNPDTIAKYSELGQAFADDPLGTLKAIGGAIIEPMVTDWKEGRYGEVIGRGCFDIASTIVGDKGVGKLGKLGKLDDLARGTNRTDDVVRNLDNIPCVGFIAPKGRGPGLAAPLLEGCARGTNGADRSESSLRPPQSPLYEVGFEARLQRGTDYTGVSDGRHFAEANRQLHTAMQADPAFAQVMEELYPGITQGVQPGPRGAYSRRPPTQDVTWHHHPNREGVLQLVPRAQHRAPGPVQDSLHPDGRGGMENWGGGR